MKSWVWKTVTYDNEVRVDPSSAAKHKLAYTVNRIVSVTHYKGCWPVHQLFHVNMNLQGILSVFPLV